MTATMLPPLAEKASADESTATTESAQVATLRRMLGDPAERENWPEIERAIDYLIRKTFVADLAA